MMWKVAEPRYDADPILARALDVLFILHADHEQNCGTTAMRTSWAPAHGDPYVGDRRGDRRALRAASRRRQRGGAQDARPRSAASRTSRRSSRRSSRARRTLEGFGHRVYKNFDPRATIIKKTADEVFTVTGKNPLLDIALKLEEIALADDYFISRKLYPNVDFYSGLIYQAMGFPPEMFTVLFAIPRTSGWLAHFQELLDQDLKIARPRQLYIGTRGARLRADDARA